MKSQELDAVKALPVEELKLKVQECEQKIFKLRFSKTISEVKNPLEIRNLKRFKARLLTWIRQKDKGVVLSK